MELDLPSHLTFWAWVGIEWLIGLGTQVSVSVSRLADWFEFLHCALYEGSYSVCNGVVGGRWKQEVRLVL